MKRRLVAAGVILSLATGAHAQSDAAKAFGAREDVRQVSLSPDGKHLALVRSTSDAGSALFILDVVGNGTQKPILKSSGRPDHLNSCRWSTSVRLICEAWTMSVRDSVNAVFTRIYTINADGSDFRELSYESHNFGAASPQYGGGIIDLLGDGDDGGAVLMIRAFGTGLGVEQVDTVSLKRKQVEYPNDVASDFITDGHGKVRIMAGVVTRNSGMIVGRTNYFYRKAGTSQWLPLSTVTSDGSHETGFVPLAVDRDQDVAYGFDVSDTRQALFRISLDGSLKRELVLDDANVDIDQIVRIGRQGRVVGASFATDKRQVTYFDPKLKALATSLGRALPNQSIVEFVDASADEQKLVIFAGSDIDPGRYYFYDRSTHNLREIMGVRPLLDGTTLATQKSISFRAADGTMIPAYLTLPPGSDGKGLPAIVLPHGGPGARDEWGFDWLSQFFANRGYAVLQPNFRGSTGYGDSWFQKNGFQSWRVAISDVNDAGRYLLSSGITVPGKLGIFGWSYGGYAALQSSVLDPDLFKAIVAVAPVTDLATLRNEAAQYTSGLLVEKFIGHGSEVERGSPAQNIGSIKAPVLLFHGDLDTNVGVGESRMMASRLRAAGKPVEYIEYKGLDHQLDDSAVRAEMLGKSDAFFRKAMGL